MDAAFLEPAEQGGEALGDGLRLVLAIGGPVDADRGDVLDQQDIGRDLRDAALGEADHEDTAAPGDAAEAGVEDVSADRVVDHVGPGSAGQFLDAGADVFGLVIDQVIGAPAGRDLQLFGGARRGDDGGAHGLADLDGGQADASGGAVDDQGFTGAEAGALPERYVRGAVDDGETGGRFEIHACRGGGTRPTRMPRPARRSRRGRAAPSPGRRG